MAMMEMHDIDETNSLISLHRQACVDGHWFTAGSEYKSRIMCFR